MGSLIPVDVVGAVMTLVREPRAPDDSPVSNATPGRHQVLDYAVFITATVRLAASPSVDSGHEFNAILPGQVPYMVPSEADELPGRAAFGQESQIGLAL